MNLLMTAPLCDSRGKIRYFLGAQVDCSGLAKECIGLDALQLLEAETEASSVDGRELASHGDKRDEFRELSEMMNVAELETARKWGGRMHRDYQDDDKDSLRGGATHRPRVILKEPQADLEQAYSMNNSQSGRLGGVYQNVRTPSPKQHPNSNIC